MRRLLVTVALIAWFGLAALAFGAIKTGDYSGSLVPPTGFPGASGAATFDVSHSRCGPPGRPKATRLAYCVQASGGFALKCASVGLFAEIPFPKKVALSKTGKLSYTYKVYGTLTNPSVVPSAKAGDPAGTFTWTAKFNSAGKLTGTLRWKNYQSDKDYPSGRGHGVCDSGVWKYTFKRKK